MKVHLSTDGKRTRCGSNTTRLTALLSDVTCSQCLKCHGLADPVEDTSTHLLTDRFARRNGDRFHRVTVCGRIGARVKVVPLDRADPTCKTCLKALEFERATGVKDLPAPPGMVSDEKSEQVRDRHETPGGDGSTFDPFNPPALASAQGETCTICGEPAELKVEQSDPPGFVFGHRDDEPLLLPSHPLTAYVCRSHFNRLLLSHRHGGKL